MSQNDENNDFLERAASHNSKKKLSAGDWLIRILIVALIFGVVKEAIHFATSTRNGWSTDNTNDVFKSLKDGLKNMPIDSSSKQVLINCVIIKLKNKYPQGLSEVNDDSLKNTTAKFIVSCGANPNINLGWSPTADSVLRVKLMQSTLIKDLPDMYKKPFCDCYIGRMKELYPQGLTESLRQSTKDSITIFCKQKVVK